MTAYFAVGLPTHFTHWCERLLVELVTASRGSVEIVPATTVEEFARAALASEATNLLVQVRGFNAGLRAALETAQKRFLVTLDTPFAACEYLCGDGPLQAIEKVRLLANGCAAMGCMMSVQGALRLHAVANRNDPLGIGMAMADWFGLGLDAAMVGKLLAQLAPLEAAPPSEETLDGFPADVRAMVTGALGGYGAWFAGRGVAPLIWTRELFHEGDPPHAPALGPIALTGRVRTLLAGPYISLPLGPWAATVSLEFSHEAAGLGFAIEVLGGPHHHMLARTSIQPSGAGVFEASTAFTVGLGTEQPIILRVSNDRAAIHGQLTLRDVVVVPLTRPV